MPSLTVYLNGASPSVFPLDKPVVNVGRNTDNEISIDENHVSSVHARLKREPNGDYRITDLGSSNGSSLNGKPLGDTVLHHGDRITFGVYVRALYQNKVIDSSPVPEAPKPSPKPAASSNMPATVARMAAQATPSLPMAVPESSSRTADTEADLFALNKEYQLMESKLSGIRREQQDISSKIREGRSRLAQLSQEIATTEQLNLQSEDQYQRLQDQIDQARQELRNSEELQRVQTHTLEENRLRVQQLIQEKNAAETQWNEFQEQASAKFEKTKAETHAALAAQQDKITALEESYAKRQKELASIIRTIDTKRSEAEQALEIKTAADDNLLAQLAASEEKLATNVNEIEMLTAALKDAEGRLNQKTSEIETLTASIAETGKLSADDRLDGKLAARGESLDYLNDQWDKTKLELGNARHRLEEQLAEVAANLEARQAEAADLDRQIDEKKNTLAATATATGNSVESAIPQAQDQEQADNPHAVIPPPKKRLRIDVPQTSDATLIARLKQIESAIEEKQKHLDDVTLGLEKKTAELREADSSLFTTNSRIQQATDKLHRSQNAAGRYVPPPAPLIPSSGHRLLPRSNANPFASATPPSTPEEQFLALTVLAPGAGYHSQTFPHGAGTPDLYLHPPIGLHALAACTHGAVKSAFQDDVIHGTTPILLALPGDFDACIDSMTQVLGLNHGRPRIALLTPGIFNRLGGDLEKSTHFQALASRLGQFEGVVSIDGDTARLVDSLTTVRHHLHLATPYPIDCAEWEFSIALDKRVPGLFFAADGFDPQSQAHRDIINLVNRLANEFHLPVTTYQHSPGDIPGLDIPRELLTQADKKLNYNQYISLAASHRFITGFGPNLANGDIWGDALLCRNLYVGLPAENAEKLFADTVAPAHELHALAAKINDLAENSQTYLDHVEKSQWLALEKLSFQAARNRLEEFVESVAPAHAALPILVAG